MKTNKLLATLAIVSVVLISGCKKDMYQEVIGKCPIVVSTSPANGDTNVSVYKVITATFNEGMNESTIKAFGTFTTQGSPAIIGTVTYKDSVATFTPASPLTPNHKYTGRITTAARDLSGNSLQKDYVWTFTTGANIPPKIIYTDPKNNDTGVVLNKKITAIFSVPMNSSTITAAGTFSVKVTSTSAVVLGTVAYSNSTAIFTPTGNLLPGTTYTAKITTAAKNIAGTAMAADSSWSFTTGVLIAPIVIYTNPANGDTGVVLNKIVTATFSVPMNSSTITAVGTYTIKQTLTPFTTVAGIVTYSGSTAIFSPTGNLLPGTEYTATITTAAKNLAGTSLANTYSWSFTTLSLNAPIVIYTDPKDNDTAIILNKIVTAIFSVPMNPSTILAVGTFTLKQTLTSTPVVGGVSYSGSTAIFTPTGNLLPNTQYTATITTAAKNPAGTPMVANKVWKFKTLTLIAPTVIYTDPKNNDTGVVLNKNITAIFSVPMNSSTLTALGTFTLKRGLVTVAGAVSYSSSTAIFNPTNDLLPGTVYTAKITTAAKNVAGTAMALDYIWTFKTAVIPSTAPLVISTDPQDLDTGVAVNKTVTATFNMPMKLSSITALGTFTLKLGLTTVSGVVSYIDTTASFNPTTDLLFDTTYTATISIAAQNVAGTPMASAYSWTFKTKKDTTVTTVDILKSAGNYGMLAGVALTNAAGPSEIHDMNIGIYPGARSSITGFFVVDGGPGLIFNGVFQAADDGAAVAAILLQAKQDLTDAYNYLAGASAPAPATIAGDQGGETLAPGIYKSTSSLLIQNGNLTLDAQGDANAVWIFQIGTTFTSIGGGPFPSSTGGNVKLIGNAQAKNVYWQVGSSAVIGDYTQFYGNIVALTSITMNSFSRAQGRMLCRNGAVTMTSTNILLKP